MSAVSTNATKQSKGKHDRLGFRLADILIRLNDGERVDTHDLAEHFGVSLRTIDRDLKSRLAFLAFTENGPRYYQVDKAKQGHLTRDEVQRFARFASIQDLFPETDRRFFQEKLQQSVTIKGFQYEDIRAKQSEFELITTAIEQGQFISFTYRKVSAQTEKTYRLAPYHLVNKNGIWYVVGLDDGKQKTYCFTQISQLSVLPNTFKVDEILREQIRQTDSIYYGNQVKEIVINVNARVAGYFQRRTLLPNQEIIRELTDGNLLISCKNINPMEVIPIVQYWIPDARIISPKELQGRLENTLKNYLTK